VRLVQQARRDGLTIRKLIPKGDKISRANAATVRFESGLFYVHRKAPYLREFVEELTEFPNFPHDDIVDVVSYACIETNKVYGTTLAEETEDEVLDYANYGFH